MPVPTETFRNIRKLNYLFAAAALLLLFSTLWLIVEDWRRDWRAYQQSARVWEAAMTQEQLNAVEIQTAQEQVEQLKDQIRSLQESMSDEQLQQIKQLEQRIAKAGSERDKLSLKAASLQGEIGPKLQQIERALLAHPSDSPEVSKLRDELAKIRRDHTELADVIGRAEIEISLATAEMGRLLEDRNDKDRQVKNLERRKQSLEDKLKEFAPPDLPSKLGEHMRNAPLMQWFNPSEKVRQEVVPLVHTDLNFGLTVETIDRCATCHVNIDNPRFETTNLTQFIERQLARGQQQPVDQIDHPVVMIEFWETAIDMAGSPLLTGRAKARTEALKRIAQTAGADAGINDSAFASLTAEQLVQVENAAAADALAGELKKQFDRILAIHTDSSTDIKAAYQPMLYYLQDLKTLLADHLGDDGFKQLSELYRRAIIARYNVHRKNIGLSALNDDPVLLAHPRLELYVDPESKHPIKMMGCTVCHEGSGQETSFHHSAHTPREMWVDAVTGTPVAGILLEKDADAHETTHGKVASAAGFSIDGAQVAYAASDAGHASHGSDGEVYSHFDVKITDASNPAPFAPEHDASHQATYRSPADPDKVRHAVKQSQYWMKKFHWHPVHYMEWEKPMHSMEFIEASCNRCHTEVFDVKDAAPKLFEGRHQFVALGCANCHAVTDLQDDLDVRRVGPSLIHAKHKLSPEMMASWIWAPKAFRPTTRMPHYFMLENNSDPVDILRTRTEVAAMTHYLQQAEPNPASYEKAPPQYKPEPLPEGIEGNAKRGRQAFNALGCLACHSNVSEHGEKWIVEDLMAREALNKDDARSRFAGMTFNQQHWYAMEHLSDKLETVGPELSGVGTKLKAGRTIEQARQWLFDWLKHPRHYSDTTIMPSFRLSSQEAMDLTEYLLGLERPQYTPDKFELDDDGKKMLDEIMLSLLSAQGPREYLADQLRSRQVQATEAAKDPRLKAGETYWTHERKLQYVGEKMIGHYGCNGCHQINGFETATSACASLDDWGLKDPHKIDHGYFEHIFDDQHDRPVRVWKVKHEGLTSDAPQITHKQAADHLGDAHAAIRPMLLKWEHLSGERRPWLYHKLHNPRMYDRGKTAIQGQIREDGTFEIGKPYDKLKMPKFFVTDEQARALVTYVTSIRRPLVDPLLQKTTDEAGMHIIRGRQAATLYNCYGCHNIEGNAPRVWQYMNVFNDDGTFNYTNLNNAPPRLIGQGAKTQPDWLFYFLQHVHTLRPWLEIRMPSFLNEDNPHAAHHSHALVDYFAGWSQHAAGKLHHWTEQIEAYRAQNPQDQDWYSRSRLTHAAASLKAFGVKAELIRPDQLDERINSSDDLRKSWNKLLQDVQFLRKVFDVQHPFVQTPRPVLTDEQFARGEALFNELRCVQCHAFGDEQKLQKLWDLEQAAMKAEAATAGTPETPAPAAQEEEDDWGDETKEEEDDWGDDDGDEAAPADTGQPMFSAPNLIYTARRLQWSWVDGWMQEPATIQPGTKMPQWFPGGHSAFTNYPHDLRAKSESMYGYSGDEQIKTLMDFMYAAGNRNYTPGDEKLFGVESTTKVEIKPLERPAGLPDSAQPTAPVAGDGQTTAPAAGTTDATTPAATSTTTAPTQEATTSSIELHDGEVAHQGTRIVGVVNFEGRARRPRPIAMAADRYCVAAHPGTRVMDEQMIVNSDNTLRNVVIHVKSGLPSGAKFDIPADKQKPHLDQVGCVYHPHVLGIVAGTPLLIINSDSTLHNVDAQARINAKFNEGMPVKGMTLTKVLDKPEMAIPFKCQVHPWMIAYVHVFSHPFFSVSDVEGRFEITGLPPGTYELEARHEFESIPPVTFTVTVKDNTSQRVDAKMTGN